MSDFTSVTDADGVAVITWDVTAKSMNVMTHESMAHLNDLIDAALADGSVKGIVITSGKDSFAGGMDLNTLAKIRDEGGDDPAQGRVVVTMVVGTGVDPVTYRFSGGRSAN